MTQTASSFVDQMDDMPQPYPLSFLPNEYMDDDYDDEYDDEYYDSETSDDEPVGQQPLMMGYMPMP